MPNTTLKCAVMSHAILESVTFLVDKGTRSLLKQNVMMQLETSEIVYDNVTLQKN